MRGLLLLALAAWGTLADICAADVEARVRPTPGGPQLFIDGSPVPPRMFWGRQGTGPIPLSATWTRHEITFTPRVDSARTSIHFRFCKNDRSRLFLRGVSLRAGNEPLPTGFETAFADAAAFGRAWKVWPPREDRCTLSVTGGVCTVAFGTGFTGQARDNDYHFYSQFLSVKAGVTCTFAFEARGEGCDWILPAVYDVAEGGAHAAIPCDDADTLTATARKAAAAGVDVVSYGVPDAWGETGDDFSGIDAVTESLIRANPNVRLIPRVSVNAPAWWCRRHPDHRMQFAAEHMAAKGRATSIRPDMAAVSSRLYRREAVAYIRRVVRHLQTKYPRHFIGIHPTGQNTQEWFYFESWKRMNGYDPQTREAFRAYLGDPAAEVPSVAERMAGERERHLLDPVTQRRCLAFNRFQQREMTDFIAELAQACRAESRGRKLVVFFYGYAYEFAGHRYGPANSGHYGVQNLLEKAAGAIDILCSPISYSDRAWCGSAGNMSCGETVLRQGVLWLNEDDSRTFLDHRSSANVQEGSRVDLRQTQQVLLRNTAQEAIRGFGSWWMDLPGLGWYNAKELWDVQAALMPLERRMCRRTKPFSPEVALIQDEESMLHVAANAAPGNGRLVSGARAAVNRTGVPHGQYLLFDVLTNPLAAKLQVFQSCWCLPDAAVEGLLEQKRTHPAVRVWCWAAGVYDEDGREDLVRASRLTGLTLVPHDLSKDRRVVAKATAVGVAAGLSADRWLGTTHPLGAAFTVTETRPEEVWARYPNGDPAIVVRGNDVFLGVPELTVELLRVLMERAGCTAYLPKDEIGLATLWAAPDVDDAGGVLSLQAQTNAVVHLQFPLACTRVADALTGEVLGTSSRLPLSLRQGEVRVLSFSSSAKSCP